MADAKPTVVDDGSLKMVIYDFPNSGDILPVHEHTLEDVHYTIVIKGVVKMIGSGQKEKIYGVGSIIKIEPFKEHGFVSFENNTRIVNIPYGEKK